MQTLNVGAGRTDEEYQAAEDQRRADLRAESRSDANYFFVAAILAAIGGGLFLVRLNILVTIGAIELLTVYGRSVGNLGLVVYGAGAAWVGALVGLGFAAQKGYRWAFWAGIILYGADMIGPRHYDLMAVPRSPCLLRVQVVPGTKSAARSRRTFRLGNRGQRLIF